MKRWFFGSNLTSQEMIELVELWEKVDISNQGMYTIDWPY